MSRKRISEVLKERFGCKIYKLSLDAGLTCPNRDGTKGYGGCIFCSGRGSGEFAEGPCGSIAAQLENAKKRVEGKVGGGKYLAYFQSFSNTYGDINYLRKIYFEAIAPGDIVGLAIATRPDCVSDEVISLLHKVNEIKPVWVELGLQTADDEVGKYIRRGYSTADFADAVKRLHSAGIETVAHIIIGLPGDDPVKTAKFVSDIGVDGVKFHLLHIIKGTELEKEYEKGAVTPLTLEEYTEILKNCISVLREEVIIHRLTGDGDKKTLIAPLWSGDKKRVLNHVNKALGGL